MSGPQPRDAFPDGFSILAFAGMMVSFALIHGLEGALGDVALVARAFVPFVLFAFVGMILAAVSYLFV